MCTRRTTENEDFRLVLEWSTKLRGTPNNIALEMFTELLQYEIEEEERREE